VGELQNPKVFVPFSELDLPPMILGKFRENDGELGRIVLVDKRIESKDDSTALGKFVQIGRNIADSVERGAPVAGDLPISYDMFQAILQDGPKATFFAFLAVVFLVILLFRNIRTIGLVLIALSFGVIWLAGIILGLHLKINFLNFIALPITFGIGVDYGVNIFQRYREEGSGSILRVIRDTGGAVMLSSFTTSVGYSSLLIAGNQAFVSFGRLAVLGEMTCLAAAVFSLPAFLCYREQKRKKFVFKNDAVDRGAL
jgi:predicted RND superfamily exporter protein